MPQSFFLYFGWIQGLILSLISLAQNAEVLTKLAARGVNYERNKFLVDDVVFFENVFFELRFSILALMT